MARVLKYQQIEGFLREELSSGKFQPEERFYSENEIAARFGVTQLTARKAFVALENAGFLKRKRGLGTFVARPPRTPERLALFRRCIVGVILPERPDGPDLKQGRLLSAVQHAVERAGYLVMLAGTEPDALLEAGVAGLIVLGTIPARLEQRLLDAGVPVIGLNFHHPRLRAIRVDYQQAGRELVNFLRQRGTRHLAITGEGDDAANVAALFLEPLQQAAATLGVHCSTATVPTGRAEAQLTALMAAAEPPDALFVLNSWCLETVRLVVERHGRQVGRDLSIVVHGLNSLLIPADPPYSIFDIDDATLAEALTGELLAAIRGEAGVDPVAFVRYSPVIDRGSIIK